MLIYNTTYNAIIVLSMLLKLSCKNCFTLRFCYLIFYANTMFLKGYSKHFSTTPPALLLWLYYKYEIFECKMKYKQQLKSYNTILLWVC